MRRLAPDLPLWARFVHVSLGQLDGSVLGWAGPVWGSFLGAALPHIFLILILEQVGQPRRALLVEIGKMQENESNDASTLPSLCLSHICYLCWPK